MLVLNQIKCAEIGDKIFDLKFSRIDRKLRTHQYRDHNEFAADMRQMFTETYKYNNPESSMVTNAGKLQKEFELRWVRIPIKVY